jgi:hypothetical protein
MLRSKLETRLRGLVAFSILTVMGALVSGISARNTPTEICALLEPAPSRLRVFSVEEGPDGKQGRQITVVRVGSDCPPPQPPRVPLPPQPPAGVFL